MLERHFHTLISTHLARNHPLSNCQWGFQSGKSTETALLATTYEWFTQLEARNDICAIFFDLQKAFDSVPHRALMAKLHSLDLDPYILHWLCSYLTNREQKVVIEGASSGVLPVISGVSQGSVLGPLLFLVYIDDVMRVNFPTDCKLTVYADDMLLYMPMGKIEEYQHAQLIGLG